MKIARKMVFCLLIFLHPVLYAQNADIRLLRAFNSPGNLSSDGFFRFVSDTELYLVIMTPLAIGGYGLVRKDDKQFRIACVIASSSLVCAGVTNLLKYSIGRDRPFVKYPDIIQKYHADSPSFPSGHTSSAFATATSLSLAYSKWYVAVPAYGWAATVGYSRMHLGVHYPSDVFAGAVIGAGSAWLSHIINKKLLNNHSK